MLRGQRGRCRNIKGKIFGSFPSSRPRPLFSLVVVVMVGLGQPQLRAKLKVASFSDCTNIKGEPHNFWELLWHRATSTFSVVWDFMMGLGKPQQPDNFEVASITRCRNIIGKSQNFGELP